MENGLSRSGKDKEREKRGIASPRSRFKGKSHSAYPVSRWGKRKRERNPHFMGEEKPTRLATPEEEGE